MQNKANFKTEVRKQKTAKSVQNLHLNGVSHPLADYVLACQQTFSTIVENVRQINLFLQNKANFRKSQMNISLIITRDYEKNIEQDIW